VSAATSDPAAADPALAGRRGLRIAVVGAGVSGLVAAYLLSEDHDVTVFEAASWPGGHANTVDVDDDGTTRPVDTGFVVFNDKTYPSFRRLLDRLGVGSQPTDMSFSVRCERTGLEYNGTSINTLFAQRRNLFRPSFHRMIRDILRFYREAPELLEQGDDGITLMEYLRKNRYSSEFVDQHIIPMGGAVWSTAPDVMERFPARYFVEFFRNHGFLEVDDRPQWFTVQGGSRSYVERIIRPIEDGLRLSTPVESVRRHDTHVDVVPRGGAAERFDVCVIAAHADQALRMLADPSDAEREVLGAVPYSENRTLLHTDARLLPRARLARASWNYHRLREDGPAVAVTYDMTRLQRLPTRTRFLTSLNRGDAVDPASVIDEITYHHPVYTPPGVAAQRRWGEINGARRTFFCGAYWSYGFHEDGVKSGLRVAGAFGKVLV
jgi:predicted NAD/FAD-binding protein